MTKAELIAGMAAKADVPKAAAAKALEAFLKLMLQCPVIY